LNAGTKVRVYIACSLDGFIAGPGGDLSWLPGATPATQQHPLPSVTDPGALEYDDFIRNVGALLMGRGTYEAVLGFGGLWPYKDLPVLVATHAPLEAPRPSVRPVSGTIGELVDKARKAAGVGDVYLDGGDLIRQALEARLVDDLVVTLVPVVLGRGHPLFAGLPRYHELEFVGHYRFGPGMLQVHVRPRA
jgi:dihydrofolate reductase